MLGYTARWVRTVIQRWNSKMDFASESPVYRAKEPFLARDEQTRLTFQWCSLTELEKITLYPSFLVQGLRNLPEQTVHVLDNQRGA